MDCIKSQLKQKWISSPIFTHLGDSLLKNKSQNQKYMFSISTNYLWCCSWTFYYQSIKTQLKEWSLILSVPSNHSAEGKSANKLKLLPLDQVFEWRTSQNIKTLFPIEHSNIKTAIIMVFPNSCWLFLHTTIYEINQLILISRTSSTGIPFELMEYPPQQQHLHESSHEN